MVQLRHPPSCWQLLKQLTFYGTVKSLTALPVSHDLMGGATVGIWREGTEGARGRGDEGEAWKESGREEGRKGRRWGCSL